MGLAVYRVLVRFGTGNSKIPVCPIAGQASLFGPFKQQVAGQLAICCLVGPKVIALRLALLQCPSLAMP